MARAIDRYEREYENAPPDRQMLYGSTWFNGAGKITATRTTHQRQPSLRRKAPVPSRRNSARRKKKANKRTTGQAAKNKF